MKIMIMAYLNVSGSLLKRIVIIFIQFLQTVIQAKLLSKLNGTFNMKLILSSLYIFCVVSLLNSEKGVRIKQLTDTATIVLQKLYYAGLNNIKY